MGSRVTEVSRPVAIGVNASITTPRAGKMGGFYAKTAGTLTAIDSLGVTVLDAIPVVAGWNTIPFFFDNPIATFTTAGGASGYIAI